MQSSAPLPAERKMTPEDGARIQKFNEERLTLPSNEAELGARFASNPVLAALGTDSPDLFYVLYWNDVALDVVSIDHTNTALTSLGSQYYAEQFGPPRASRALAIVHLAMFEAADALTKEFNSFKKDPVTTAANRDPCEDQRRSRATGTLERAERRDVVGRRAIADFALSGNQLRCPRRAGEALSS